MSVIEPDDQVWLRRQRGQLITLGAGGSVANAIAMWVLTIVSLAMGAAALGSHNASSWVGVGFLLMFASIGVVVSGLVSSVACGVVSGLIARRTWRASRGWLIGWIIVWTTLEMPWHAVCSLATLVGILFEEGWVFSVVLLGSIAGSAFLGAVIAFFFALIAPPWNIRS
ncbi:MAG: hypothetical protein NZ699_06590 [Roseiflexus sp.]|nr:hypothetical protein [Roseiflexus sp.]MDW8147328.1 hypothetical protein [Roseiflexaceae bacterium]